MARRCLSSNARSATPPTPPIRRGRPTLFSIVGREAEPRRDFSAGFATAKFKWMKEARRLAGRSASHPIPGAIMPYKQAKPELRVAIVSYLKELH
jgi:cytochrome c